MTARPEELLTAHEALKAAVAEPHDIATDRVVDAVLALLAYVERFPVPPPVNAEPDRESILTDPVDIAARHQVNVTALLDRIEVTASIGQGVAFERNEALFMLDLLTVLGFE